MNRFWLAAVLSILVAGTPAMAEDSIRQTKGTFDDKFRQLEADLPSPNTYRTASGAPGESYWQQQADYVIGATLDETAKRITATGTITYRNNSPHPLNYVWLQLDQNIFKENSASRLTQKTTGATDSVTIGTLRQLQSYADKPHGYDIASVTDGSGRVLPFTINDTMMRVDLPRAVDPKQTVSLKISWAYNITDHGLFGGRTGYEYFRDSDTYTYFVAHWFPRLVAYTDYTGWQHKQFLGSGEFTLEFGNYDVSLTVPSDHVLTATGVLQNPNDVLTAEQRNRLAQARKVYDKPIYIVTPDEALANEKEGVTSTRTWRWKASNVRDFAWSSSRKFIWDAMAVKQPEGEDVLAQSFFPNEGDPLWSLYSTRAVAHTIDVYSEFLFSYPYPTAISVNTWVGGGMEYPMLSFNGGRPVKDAKTGVKTYTRQARDGMIGVIIHEVGHVYVPMIINTDERQWTWMDEGLNSFLDYHAKKLWDEDFPARNGASNILDAMTAYMMSEDQVPIMTNSETLPQFGNNAYGKPTAALTVLRETVMGRELFDFALKEYARRWKFKRPTPSDFFRTMEDASGVDLDWFWRGWFYTTDHVDIALKDVREYRLSTRDPDVEGALQRQRDGQVAPDSVTVQENREAGLKTYMDRHPDARDFYSENDAFEPTNKDRNDYQTWLAGLKEPDKSAFERALRENPYIYFMDFENIGGLVSPLPLRFTYEDGTTKDVMIPAEIWRMDSKKTGKMFVETKRVVSVELDARHQIADAVRSNNAFPQRNEPNRLDLFRSGAAGNRNQMADAMVELKSKDAAPASSTAPLAPTGSPTP
jgi:hypothetical protein